MGTLLASYAERLASKPPSIPDPMLERLEVGLAAGIIENSFSNTIDAGVAGALLASWALHKADCLPRTFPKALEAALDAAKGRPRSLTDLYLGQAGLLLGMVRALEFIPTPALRPKAEELFRTVDSALLKLVTLSPPERVEIGFAHGIGGAIWSIHEAARELGLRSSSLDPALDLFQRALEGQVSALLRRDNPPFCGSPDGCRALLWRMGISSKDGASKGDRPWTATVCCGLTGLAMAWDEPSWLPDGADLAPTSSIHGYLTGDAGIAYAQLAKCATLYDPIWGSRIFGR